MSKIKWMCKSIKEVEVDDKVQFDNEKLYFTVKARNERFIICVRPYKAVGGTWYTIVDLQEHIRGHHDVFRSFDFLKIKDINKVLKMVSDPEIKHPIPDNVPLRIKNIKSKK